MFLTEAAPALPAVPQGRVLTVAWNQEPNNHLTLTGYNAPPSNSLSLL